MILGKAAEAQEEQGKHEEEENWGNGEEWYPEYACAMKGRKGKGKGKGPKDGCFNCGGPHCAAECP